MRKRMNVRKTVLLAAAAMLAALLGGCRAGTPQIVGGEVAGPENENSAAFLDRVSSLDTVSENDACRGVILLLDGEDARPDFAARVRALRERDVVGHWNMDASAPVTRGRLAYMIYQATDMPGGLILTAFGPSERYCLRELQYRGIMVDGLGNTQISGMEYVAVLRRADAYTRTGEFPDSTGGLYAGRGTP